jgi:hypothetical protein
LSFRARHLLRCWQRVRAFDLSDFENCRLTLRFLFAYVLFVSRLYRVSFRAFLLPEGFGCPATIVTIANNAQQAAESACRWYKRNQPYYVSNEDCETASLEKFRVVELEYFVCYGIDKPMLWEFPPPMK